MKPCQPLTRSALYCLLVCTTSLQAMGTMCHDANPCDSLPRTEVYPTSTSADTTRTNSKVGKRLRTVIVAGSSVAVLGGTYTYLRNKWWTENSPTFHFDKGKDWRYASNLDKMGHVMGGIIASNLYYDAFRWAGLEERKAAWAAFGMSTGIQLAIEIKDGYANAWGFSIGDIVFGSLGSLMPVLEKNSPFLQNTDFKFSYWQRTDKYFKRRGIKVQSFHIDDYLNQTYWMSTNLKYITQGKVEWIPDWLGLSIGWGIDPEMWDENPVDYGTGGKPEFYIAPDIDLVRLFKPKKKFWKFTLKQLNYLKFPMPTLQLTQGVKFWPVFF